MHMILAAVFVAMSVPALWAGLKLVVAFSLPFPLFCVPLLLCFAIALWFVAKADAAA